MSEPEMLSSDDGGEKINKIADFFHWPKNLRTIEMACGLVGGVMSVTIIINLFTNINEYLDHLTFIALFIPYAISLIELMFL
jgi:hypothetical protein